MSDRKMIFYLKGLSIFLALNSSACSVLIGNIDPVATKSTHYEVMDLTKAPRNWTVIDQAKAFSLTPNEKVEDSDLSDLAYQSPKTGAVISLNSACRKRIRDSDLKSLTDLLFLSLNEITERNEKTLTIDQQAALDTTVRGKMNSEEMMMRTIVLTKDDCVFDLVYIALPKHFPDEEPIFQAFMQSFRLVR